MSIEVSIIITTYNRAKELLRCLDSVSKQIYRDFEVIICDDGSTDDTSEIVDMYKDILNLHYFWFKNFGGPARGRNIGINNSKGKFIAFLDSDDWWTAEKLKTSIDYLKNGADLVYHDLWLIGTKGKPFIINKAKTRVLFSPIKKDLLLNGNAINNSSVVLRKSILDNVGLLSEDRDLIAGEDYDYWIRISEVTEKFVRIPMVLGYYWIGGGNISNSKRTILINNSIKKKI